MPESIRVSPHAISRRDEAPPEHRRGGREIVDGDLDEHERRAPDRRQGEQRCRVATTHF
jgi:hypothetical protein